MWLCQREEASKNEHVSVMFSLSPAYLLGEHLGAVKHRVASPKCRAAHSSSCPIIYCPLPNLPPLSRWTTPTLPPPPAHPLSAFTSSCWRFEDATPGVPLLPLKQPSPCILRHPHWWPHINAETYLLPRQLHCRHCTMHMTYSWFLLFVFLPVYDHIFLSSRGDMVCCQSLLLLWLIQHILYCYLF